MVWGGHVRVLLPRLYVLLTTQGTCHIEHVQIKPLIFFVKHIVKRVAGHIFDTFIKEVKTIEANKRQENGQT